MRLTVAEFSERLGIPTHTVRNRFCRKSEQIPRFDAEAEMGTSIRNTPQLLLSGSVCMALAISCFMVQAKQQLLQKSLMAMIAPRSRRDGFPYDCESLWAGRYDRLYIYDGYYLGVPGSEIYDMQSHRQVIEELIVSYSIRLELNIVRIREQLSRT